MKTTYRTKTNTVHNYEGGAKKNLYTNKMTRKERNKGSLPEAKGHIQQHQSLLQTTAVEDDFWEVPVKQVLNLILSFRKRELVNLDTLKPFNQFYNRINFINPSI